MTIGAPSQLGLIEVQFNLLPQIAAALPQQVQAVLNGGATDIAEEAIRITDVAYPPASSPGEPPAMRTGRLNSEINPVPNSGPLEALVVSDTPYATVLEFGGAHVAARPYMTPAAETAGPKIQDRLNDLAGRLGS